MLCPSSCPVIRRRLIHTVRGSLVGGTRNGQGCARHLLRLQDFLSIHGRLALDILRQVAHGGLVNGVEVLDGARDLARDQPLDGVHVRVVDVGVRGRRLEGRVRTKVSA